jgi:hypothetical protein
MALLNPFLNRFGRIIACWKGLELRNSDPLPDITFGKALHVIAYNHREVTLLKIYFFNKNKKRTIYFLICFRGIIEYFIKNNMKKIILGIHGQNWV